MQTHKPKVASVDNMDFSSWYYPFTSIDQKSDLVATKQDSMHVVMHDVRSQNRAVYILVGMNLAQQQKIAKYALANLKLINEANRNGICNQVPLLTDLAGVLVCVDGDNLWLVEHILNQLECDATTTKSLLHDASLKLVLHHNKH